MQYIRHAKNYPFAKELEAIANTIEVTPARHPNIFVKMYFRAIDFLEMFVESVLFRKAVLIFFVLQALVGLGNVILIAAFQIRNIPLLIPIIPADIGISVYAELIAIIASSVCVLIGVFMFRFARENAYQLFKYSILISILVTDIFVFYREQFQGLIILTIHIIVLVVLNFILEHEKKNKGKLPR
jgi:hypothetical protein